MQGRPKAVFAVLVLATLFTFYLEIQVNLYTRVSPFIEENKTNPFPRTFLRYIGDSRHAETNNSLTEISNITGKLVLKNSSKTELNVSPEHSKSSSPSTVLSVSLHRNSCRISSTAEVKTWIYERPAKYSRYTDKWRKPYSTGPRVKAEWNASSRSADRACYPRLFEMKSSWSSLPTDCHHVHHDDGDGRPRPLQHVFFLKTHKTGSQTLTGILNRYALTHNLTVAIRKNLRGHVNKKNWIPDIRPLPPGTSHYDMLTDHVRFDEGSLRHFLPKDTLLISIVREPLDKFVSAFYFFRNVWKDRHLKSIPGPDPVLTFLSNIKRWDSQKGSQTHSRMFYDFGLNFMSLEDPHYLQDSIHNLSRLFHLVLLTEAFDESIILLKRTLSWTLPNMLYVKFNVGPTRKFYNFSEKQRKEFEKRRKEEVAIFRHFRDVFYKKMAAQDGTFSEEVRVFRSVRNRVESFCEKVRSSPRMELCVEATQFSERFRVESQDCQLLQRQSSSVKDTWFEQLMIQRLQDRIPRKRH